MGKCAIPASHALAAGLPWFRATSDLSNMADFFSPLFREADGLLAVGCRFTQLTTGSWSMPLPPALAQIDVDPNEIGRHYPVTLGVHADAKATLAALLETLPLSLRSCWAPTLVPQEKPWLLPGYDVLGPMRRALPPRCHALRPGRRALPPRPRPGWQCTGPRGRPSRLGCGGG